jgi:hypothetical protein
MCDVKDPVCGLVKHPKEKQAAQNDKHTACEVKKLLACTQSRCRGKPRFCDIKRSVELKHIVNRGLFSNTSAVMD